MKNCLNCQNYKLLTDDKRKCLVHRCRVYRNITVFGPLEGPINPDCNVYAPVKVKKTKDMTLKEKTLFRSGGIWSDAMGTRDKKEIKNLGRKR